MYKIQNRSIQNRSIQNISIKNPKKVKSIKLFHF